MELLYGSQPRAPKTSWGAWPLATSRQTKDLKLRTRLSRSVSVKGHDLSATMFGSSSARRSTITGSIRSTRSAGATTASLYGVTGKSSMDSSRPQSINRHLLPPSEEVDGDTHALPTHESYSRPLAVVDTFIDFIDRTNQWSPLRRSQTLPPSAIKRSSERYSEADDKFVPIRPPRKFEISSTTAEVYAMPPPHTLPLPRRKNAIAESVAVPAPIAEGPYEVSNCVNRQATDATNMGPPAELPEGNQRWDDFSKPPTPTTTSSATSDAGSCYREPACLDTDPCYNVPVTASSSVRAKSHYQRLSVASSSITSSSSSSSSRVPTEDGLYSASSLSEAGSSVASFSTCTDEGVYSATASICSDDGAGSVRPARARSVRSARQQQLPVTPTLRKLLQMGLDPIGTTSQPPQQSSTIHSHVLPSHTTSSSTASSTTAPPLHSSTSTSCSTNQSGVVVRREKLHPPRTDAHRFSRANLEESGDVELDAILGELCALESQFDKELLSVSSTTDSSSAQQLLQPPSGAVNCSTAGVPLKMAGKAPAFSPTQPHVPPPPLNGSGKLSSKFDSLTVDTQDGVTPSISRTDSPDNDSAFSDSLSVLSSESSASSAASNAHRQQQLALQQQQQLLHGQNDAAQLKAEKIKLALEKIKEANVKKLFLKAFSRDGSSKSLLVDEKMTVAHVTRLLADKNHVTMDPKWTIVEHLPDLYMERVYEDDEMLVENLLLWARDSKNKLFFLDRPEKYVLFWQPENYLIPMQSSAQTDVPLDDEARNNMIEEFFSSGSIPEVEGPLFLKSEGKKAWKKFYFVLRGSGLYYCPKGKSSRSSRDLVCLVTFENNQVYQGFGWRKKHKAPTDWGFAIKPAALQTKSSKYIKYLCTDEASIMYRWIMAIRIAKCGNKLLQNYRVLVEDLAQEDIDLLASSRSFSLASVAATSSQASQATTPSSESRSLDSCLASSVATSAGDSDRDDDCDSDGDGATPVNTLNRSQQPWGTSVHGYMDDQDIVAPTAINNIYNTLASTTSNSSSSSSGCLSHRSNASTPSTEHGFESEFSQQGTIKRKPSAAPKIPLTNTTRHMLHEQERDDDVVDGVTNLNGGSPLNMGSLRLSLRRSLTDDSSSSAASTLKRRNSGSSTLPRGFSSKNNKTSTSGLPSMPAPSCQSAEVDGLPLPPPPLDLTDSSLLPPPPPELLASNLSLASSLPPPPEDMSPPNPDEMSCSMISLPPPPPPLTLPLASNMPITSHKNSPPPPPTAAKPKSPTPPPVAPKPRRPSDCTSPAVSVSPPQALPIRSVLQQPTSHPPVAPKKKRITFKDDVQNIPPTIYPSSPSPPSPCSPNKPPPPPRSDSTKLSNSPQKHPGPSANKLTPPKSFLSNLQKVMQKKWQVAEKCKDFDQTPHEVLGFRDSIPQTETERNVGLWIQEHYGCIYDHLGSSPNHNLYDGANNDNDSLPSPPLPSPPPPISPTLVSPGAGRPVSSMSLQSNTSGLSAHSSASRTSSGSRKKPPPPLPKRADSTQLSSSVSPRQ